MTREILATALTGSVVVVFGGVCWFAWRHPDSWVWGAPKYPLKWARINGKWVVVAVLALTAVLLLIVILAQIWTVFYKLLGALA